MFWNNVKFLISAVTSLRHSHGVCTSPVVSPLQLLVAQHLQVLIFTSMHDLLWMSASGIGRWLPTSSAFHQRLPYCSRTFLHTCHSHLWIWFGLFVRMDWAGTSLSFFLLKWIHPRADVFKFSLNSQICTALAKLIGCYTVWSLLLIKPP